MKLSIIIPVYNEEKTILEVLDKVLKLKIPGWEKEVIVVDDCSTDSTKQKLESRKHKVQVIYKKINEGKGAAIKTGIEVATGSHVIIQDADLEYNPQDIRSLVVTYENNPDCVIYGSRFRGRHQDAVFGHRTGNYLLTLLTNFLYSSELSDMETCYKLIPRKYFSRFKLDCQRFDFEPEVTAKLLKLGIKILEVPINYTKRGFSEGKKIKWWRDGFGAILTLIKYKFVND